MIPYSLQKQVLSELHTGHIGMVRMKATARSFVWWPVLDRDVESIVRSCSTCQEQRNKPASSTQLILGYTGKVLGNVSTQTLRSTEEDTTYC